MDINNYGSWYEKIEEGPFRDDEKIYFSSDLRIYTGIFSDEKDNNIMFHKHYDNAKMSDIKFEYLLFGQLIYRLDRNDLFLPIHSEIIMKKGHLKRPFQHLVNRLLNESQLPLVATLFDKNKLNNDSLVDITFFRINSEILPNNVVNRINKSWEFLG